MNVVKNTILGFFLLIISAPLLMAKVSLPRLVGNNMVLQRGLPITLWGWAEPGEKITITLLNEVSKAKTDKMGRWKVNISPLTAGGPYDMVIVGSNTITLKNILIGDVWLCSGQSNMEWPVSMSDNGKEEVAQANYPNIRLFSIPLVWNTKTQNSRLAKDDITGGEWKLAVGENVANFSGVGYFFGRDLYNKNKIPLGLIDNAWGGSAAEAWVSPETLKELPDFANKVEEIQTTAGYMEKKQKDVEAEKNKLTALDDVSKNKWEAFDMDDSNWKETYMPAPIESFSGYGNFDGVMWFRKEFTLTNTDSDLILSLGAIDDEDITWINGVKIGEEKMYNVERQYKIPANILKVGKNILVVRVLDSGGLGGFTAGAPRVGIKSGDGTVNVPLAGMWKYKESFFSSVPLSPPNQANTPTILYNSLIAPITNYAIKGVIWYQGETNSSAAYQYRTLFPALINDWRQQWKREFPFLFVQLANFTQEDALPNESTWAELREAQTMTLSLPNTGMATAIDIGDAKDIHPTNKQEVGRRFALVARKNVYGENIVATGPMYESMTVEGNKIRIKFSSVGAGLKAKGKYGYLEGFAIAGEDKKFQWAQGYIDGNTVIVYSENISNPVAVRYAWANNPADANLYNKEGLPAFPFRTDSWPGVTEPKK